MPGHHKRNQVEHIGEVTLVHFPDRNLMIETKILAMCKRPDGGANKQGRKKILLNFGTTQHQPVSSAFIGMLIAWNKMIRTAGGRLGLCNISPELHVVLEATGLIKVISIEDYPLGDDPDGNGGGIVARLKPPKPEDGGAVALPLPPPELED